ncbi:glycosyltransferase family 4 protein [Thiopseudomonas denitrificans]|uniref:Glycosyltransferase involved in cell wall biosynthesis n=1 Tax=Thiopseudomonas denitrificans TaxID=1501432 RepID=A0A4R6U010_9GAMM|nr:glycosyltransferase family 4 protein [Thiopseudomonas denitrificans]TDQ37595.1 glycosyltransferase involved in cell wall biosynthesis [Thiopseudomonas denitrificans]
MKILLVTQYFWPETFIINDLVKTLVAQGHEVQVFTGKPNYPEGKIFTGYTSHGCYQELYANHVPVFRAPLRPRGRGPIKLVLNYLSFVCNGIRFFPKALQREGAPYDVIFVFAPSPILSVLPAILLKWKTKTHLAVWVQDLWPESLRATGFVSNGFVLWCIGILVRAIYACSDTLLIQSRAFKASMMRYADAKKIVYYPNCYAQDASEAAGKTEVPAELLAFMEQSFCLVFAGNLGTAQSLETLVDAATRLKHLPACKFIIVGTGSMSAWLEAQKVALGLDNMHLVGRFPSYEMPQFFSRAAGLLVTLKKSDIFCLTIPSKLQAYLAAGRPIIAALDGEGARIVEEAGAGLCCAAEDGAGLARTIEKLFRMPASERTQLGVSGRRYFSANFDMDNQGRRLVEILEERIAQDREVDR